MHLSSICNTDQQERTKNIMFVPLHIVVSLQQLWQLWPFSLPRSNHQLSRVAITAPTQARFVCLFVQTQDLKQSENQPPWYINLCLACPPLLIEKVLNLISLIFVVVVADNWGGLIFMAVLSGVGLGRENYSRKLGNKITQVLLLFSTQGWGRGP